MHVSLPQHPKKVYRSNFNIRIQRSSPWKFFLEFVNSKEPKKRRGFCISPLLLISDNDTLLKKYRVEETCQNAWIWPDKLKYRVTSELSIKFLSTLFHVRFHYSRLFANVALTIQCAQWSRRKYLKKKNLSIVSTS